MQLPATTGVDLLRVRNRQTLGRDIGQRRSGFDIANADDCQTLMAKRNRNGFHMIPEIIGVALNNRRWLDPGVMSRHLLAVRFPGTQADFRERLGDCLRVPVFRDVFDVEKHSMVDSI